MNKHFQLAIDELKKELLTMGAMVENVIQRSVVALKQRHNKLAREVIVEDDVIDKLEVKIEEECLKILALYHPVAEHLRFVTTVMKINNDLERIGDLSVNIARRAKHLSKFPPIEVPDHIKIMADATMQMLRNSLNSFVDRDAILARKVCLADDEVDRHHRAALEALTKTMKSEPKHIELIIHLLWSSRNLERIADHVTNIAEDVVYMVEGDIIRHSVWDFPENSKEDKDEPEKDPTSEALPLKGYFS